MSKATNFSLIYISLSQKKKGYNDKIKTKRNGEGKKVTFDTLVLGFRSFFTTVINYFQLTYFRLSLAKI